MERKGWAFLSNHGRIFTYLATHPQVTIQALAHRTGLSLRAVSAMLDDLVEEGYITREKIGRANRYDVNLTKSLRHRLEKNNSTGDLLLGLGVYKRKNGGHGNGLENEHKR
jgi:DNA-binding MarR family transcriptional regulator